VSIYGQEANPTTWRLAAMNLVIRGMDYNLGKEPADTFSKNQHPDLRADYCLAKLLFDTRANTKTIPPTLWFIAPTNKNRKLKIVYIQKGLQLILKTAYEPNEVELAIYERFGAAA